MPTNPSSLLRHYLAFAASASLFLASLWGGAWIQSALPDGAWRAMHRAQWAAREALQAEQRTPRRWRSGFGSVRGCKVYVHERSSVRAVEVLP